MKKLLACCSAILVLTTCVFADPVAELDYQGKILISDLPFTGPGYFKLALSDSGSTTNYWANDGSVSLEPAAAVTGAVYNGFFSMILGDSSMNTIDPDIFSNGNDLYLRVWFSDDNSVFNEMLPSQKLVSSPYAINADQLDGLDVDEVVARATNAVTLAGDISGTPGSGTTINSLQGDTLATGTPSADEVLMWDGSAWTSAPITGITADLYVDEAGDEMTGILGINVGGNNDLIITNAGYGVMVGKNANGTSFGTAVGGYANGYSYGAALGANADGRGLGVGVGANAYGYNRGVGIGYYADGSQTGVAVGVQADGSDQGIALGDNANGRANGFAAGKNSTGFNYGIGIGGSAYGRSYGIAIGDSAQGYGSAVAVGSQANGSMTNIAIGVSANSQGGSERISIGHNVANNIDDSARLRGTLYMDGGSALMARSTFGSGPWSQMLPLPPLENVVYVAGNGTASGPGSIDAPFDTPQNAYNYAATIYTNVPATVAVAAGKYGSLTMFAGNIHILGYSRPELDTLTVAAPSKDILGKQRVENIIVKGAASVAADGGSDVKFHNCRFAGGLGIYGPRVEVQDCYATGSDSASITVGNGVIPVGEIAIYNSSMFNADSANASLLVNDLVYYFEVIGCEVVNYGSAAGGVPWAAIEDRQIASLTMPQVPHLYSHNVIQGAEHGTWSGVTTPAVYDPAAVTGQTICFVQNTVWGDVGMTSNQQFYANNIIYGDINNTGMGMTWGWGQAGGGVGQDAAGNTEHQGAFPGQGGAQRGFPAAWQD